MAVRKPKIQKTNGICSLCGGVFGKTAMKKHSTMLSKTSFSKAFWISGANTNQIIHYPCHGKLHS
jgi:hypothetical protein